MSDREGRFALSSVEPGHYVVIAAKGGYITAEYQADRAGAGKSIALEAGQSVADITIRLLPPGVVAGRVLDENNNPVMLASVQCMRIDYSSGRRRLAPAHGTSPRAW